MHSIRSVYPTHRPLPFTVTPPGSIPRAPAAALGSSVTGVLLLGTAALLGLADELPARIAYNDLAFRLMVHKLLLVLSAIAALSAVVLALAGWRRSRLLSAFALLTSVAWLGLFVWARFANS